MAYEKQEWKNGDTITAEKLNHMEDGIESVGGGGAFIITATENNHNELVLNKTWAEIKGAYDNGNIITIHFNDSSTGVAYCNMPVAIIGEVDGNYFIEAISTMSDYLRISFATNSENGYPQTEGAQ